MKILSESQIKIYFNIFLLQMILVPIEEDHGEIDKKEDLEFHKKPTEGVVSKYEEEESGHGHGNGHGDSHDEFSEMFVHQVIETIEFVLGKKTLRKFIIYVNGFNFHI
jgi:hypothetical protein